MTSNSAVELARLYRMLADHTAIKVREKASLSQADLGRGIGVTRPTISRWESGTRRPRGEVAMRYLALLDALHSQQSQAA